MYPISKIIIEDISTKAKRGQRRWNQSFSPLEVGKAWGYEQLGRIAPLFHLPGWETFSLREIAGLEKSRNKLAESFDAHCVDSWVLANWWTGGHRKPEQTAVLCVTPLRFHRRQLHTLQPATGGFRRIYGGTRSLGFTRGAYVRHARYGICYVGGTRGKRISLHALCDGRRLSQKISPDDCTLLTYASWRTYAPGR